MLEKRPFSKKSLGEYSNKNYGLSPVSAPRLVASPKITGSKFSPVNSIGNSPQMKSKLTPKSSFGKLDDSKSSKQSLLSKFGGTGHKVDTKLVDHEEFPQLEEKESSNDKATVNVNRKVRNIFKGIENIEKNTLLKNQDVDLPVLDGIKTTKKKEDEGKDIDSDDDDDEVKFEGYLIKISSNKTLLKRWFKLIHRDFYCNDLLN